MVGIAYLVSGRSMARKPRMPKNKFLLALAALIGLSVLAVTPAATQGLAQFSRSYVTPFPENDQYRLAVFGDSLGDGMWAGLYRAFKADTNVDVVKHSRVSTGFVRTDYFDWNKRIQGILGNESVHIAVIMVGANDMQSIRKNRKWHKVGTSEWRKIYGERIDKFIKNLKGSRAAVYWVGLPIMRKPKHNQDMQIMNEVFREKAYVNGVKFIDTWNGFADQFGRYSAFGPDLSGQTKRLRAADGVHFTMSGYRKLAHFVERAIRGDMKLAKSERNIPLAGSQSEQDRAMGRGRKSSEPTGDRQREVRNPQTDTESASASAPKETVVNRLPAGRSNKERKQSRAISGVQLVRPNIVEQAAGVLGSSYSPQGETIAHDMPNGLTALASISPFNDTNLSNVTRRLPLSQRPYYRVLIKGEQLRPKTGRTDDFAWPGS